MQLSINSMSLSYQKGTVICRGLDENGIETLNKVPLVAISELHIDSKSHIATSLLFELIARQIPLFVGSARQLPVSVCADRIQTNRTGIKQQWFHVSANKHLALYLAKRLIAAKIRFQKALIKKLHRQHYPEDTVEPNLVYNLVNLQDALGTTQLLGIEGYAAKKYFRDLSQFIPAWCKFTGRKKRPATDPCNILLSLAYTLVQDLISRALLKNGFEPLFGILHQEQDYRLSLSCDLMELWRTHADKWVLTLLDEEFITQSHFSEDDSEKQYERVVLNREGKSVFYRQWFTQRPIIEKRVMRQISAFRVLVAKHA